MMNMLLIIMHNILIHHRCLVSPVDGCMNMNELFLIIFNKIKEVDKSLLEPLCDSFFFANEFGRKTSNNIVEVSSLA
ncbi:hypothetical protein L1987_10599 [Smallanthus sonchifolius]|uniref:Uncharacterized protein n=1 Tax=Smallanthus sonchifolius TaxID=185202 RepID=A0ACB9JSI2_9ASTR|nr:hypothetical protein L1987_10599 [Smallanthus sonchifolius]